LTLTETLASNPLPLYRDGELLQPVPYRMVGDVITYDVMAFGRVDEGTRKTSMFYARNASMGVLEDVSVAVESVDRDKVTVKLLSPAAIPRMAVLEVYRGELAWKALQGVKAGPCRARIRIHAMLTHEE
jgi:hypothetical protein